MQGLLTVQLCCLTLLHTVSLRRFELTPSRTLESVITICNTHRAFNEAQEIRSMEDELKKLKGKVTTPKKKDAGLKKESSELREGNKRS